MFTACAGEPFEFVAGDVEQLAAADASDVHQVDAAKLDADAAGDVHQEAETEPPCNRYTCVCPAGKVAFCVPGCVCQ